MTDAPVPLRVLVVGGTGAFGGRLIAGLLGTTGFDVLFAGRDEARLAALVGRCKGPGGRTRAASLAPDARSMTADRSILSYAGRPVRVFADGQWGERPGWGITARRAMPGLGRRWLSLSETPDLDIVPGRFRVGRSAVFRAGLELSALHLGLLLASLPVRAGAAVFEPFGTDRGGMTVEAIGLDAAGQPVRGLWSLVAEGGDGPCIPTLPALAALRALAEGRLTCAGASACVGVLSLGEIEAEFHGRRIVSGIRFERPAPSLYEGVLGAAFSQLPEPLRRLHRPGWGLQARGLARVDGPLARVVAAVFHFSPPGEKVTVSVAIAAAPGGERWVRDFGGKRFASRPSAAGTPGRVVERFGPLAFELDLLTGPGGVLGMPVRAWRFGPLPLPRALAPIVVATERVDGEGRFRFDVELSLPFGLGRLVRYRGWLVPSPG